MREYLSRISASFAIYFVSPLDALEAGAFRNTLAVATRILIEEYVVFCSVVFLTDSRTNKTHDFRAVIRNDRHLPH